LPFAFAFPLLFTLPFAFAFPLLLTLQKQRQKAKGKVNFCPLLCTVKSKGSKGRLRAKGKARIKPEQRKAFELKPRLDL
jgi:hypothetical protein